MSDLVAFDERVANLDAAAVDDTAAVVRRTAPTVSDYVALLKPRVMSLVVFTGVVGMAVAPGAALAFGIWLSVASVTVMWMATNVAAAFVLALSIAFYVFVYTMWLKRRTPQNIVIGGAAGAFPPVIGWAAVTGDVTLVPIILFAIIFVWTPPHFWSLALWAHDDYARAGVPMLPVTAGAKETRRQIVIYSVVLAPLGLVPWLVGFSGPAYAAVAAVLGAMFLRHAVAVLRDRQDEAGRSLTRDAPARACFRFSLYYLFVLFAALAIDRLVLGG